MELGEELVTVLVDKFSDEARRVPAGAKLGICKEVERTEEIHCEAASYLPEGSGSPKCLQPDGGSKEEGATHLGSVAGVTWTWAAWGW